jgi:hypothetical protein
LKQQVVVSGFFFRPKCGYTLFATDRFDSGCSRRI